MDSAGAVPVAAAPVAATAVHPPTVASPTDTRAVPSAFAPASPEAKVNTAHVSINGNRIKASNSEAPVIPPDLQWGKPMQVQQAKPEASGGNRSVITFGGEPMTVEKVSDGDGARLRKQDGTPVVCRIDNIDAPEVAHMDYGKPHQNHGERSRKILADMIENKEVSVKITRPASADPRFGRNYCQIEIEGKDVSAEMIKKGAAWLYGRYVKDKKLTAEYDRLETEARVNKVGLWEDDPNPMTPEQFRRNIERGLVK